MKSPVSWLYNDGFHRITVIKHRGCAVTCHHCEVRPAPVALSVNRVDDSIQTSISKVYWLANPCVVAYPDWYDRSDARRGK